MKLKCQPDDFRVEEVTSFDCPGGEFAVYSLKKRSIGTPEAIDLVSSRWNLHRSRISYGGMKDRHAVTTQTFTVLQGPQRGMKQDNIEVAYLGQASRPFKPADIDANRFAIIMRDMSEPAVERSEAALKEAQRHGLPNYFDDQRFGSIGETGEFIALPWCQGNFERALWLAIAEGNSHDRPEDKVRKKVLRDLWGQWPVIATKLKGSPIDRVLRVLVERPTDFRFAFGGLRSDLRALYLDAFQSCIWNRMLSLLIRQRWASTHVMEMKFDHDRLSFHRTLAAGEREAIEAMMLPLPSARAQWADESQRALARQVLEPMGLPLEQMKTKPPRDAFFSRGDRKAFVFPEKVEADHGDDELYQGRKRVTLRFDLPRGCYATILIKRITTLAQV